MIDNIITFEEFISLFHFKSKNAWKVGIEREFFLIDENGKIIAESAKYLEALNDTKRFCAELPACQIESQIGPINIDRVRYELLRNKCVMDEASEKTGIYLLADEVAPSDVPLIITATERYKRVWSIWSPEQRKAACSIIGTHIQIGMPDAKTAILVLKLLTEYFGYFKAIGDHSDGKRIEEYLKVVPNPDPVAYDSWHEFYEDALMHDFAYDPKSNWRFIRINANNGTVEIRVFGQTPNIDEIVGWANEVFNIIKTKFKI